jgi:hypothetical protein
MAFDFADLDTLTLSERGVDMPLVNLRTRAALIDDDGTPLTITLAGRQSDTFRSSLKSLLSRRAEAAARNPGTTDTDTKEIDDIEILIACTLGWTFKIFDKQPFPCTPLNIRKLWNDPRFRPQRAQAMDFLLTDANFLALPLAPLLVLPVASSSSTAPSPTTAELSPPRSRVSA